MRGVPANDNEQKLVGLITRAMDSFERSFETEAEVANLFEELNLTLQQLTMGQIDPAQFQAKGNMLIDRIGQMTSDRFERELERIEIFETMVKLQ
jgi:predicted Ser/Thr protein kinase